MGEEEAKGFGDLEEILSLSHPDEIKDYIKGIRHEFKSFLQIAIGSYDLIRLSQPELVEVPELKGYNQFISNFQDFLELLKTMKEDSSLFDPSEFIGLLRSYYSELEDVNLGSIDVQKMSKEDKGILELLIKSKEGLSSIFREILGMDKKYNPRNSIKLMSMTLGLGTKKFDIYFNGIDEGLNFSVSLGKIFRNLIGNAMKYAFDGTEEYNGVIGMDFSETDQDYVFQVSDNGKGINAKQVALRARWDELITKEQYDSMSEQEKLYLIFKQGVSTGDASKHEGHGLSSGYGLNYVKERVESLGGRIDVETKLRTEEQEGGTTFTFTIPKRYAA